jgi:hypothetical protein
MNSIATDRFRSLRLPVSCARLRYDQSKTAFVHMPKTAMYKNDLTTSWKDDIRLSRKINSVKGVSETLTMNDRAYSLLWPSVLASDSGHIVTALFGGEVVGHIFWCVRT